MDPNKEMTNLEVYFISFVKNPANRKKIVIKGETIIPKRMSLKNTVVSKSIDDNDKEGIIYGEVYIPETPDTEGNWMSAQEIRKAAYNFMKNQRIKNIDTFHKLITVDAYVAESWIVEKNDKYFDDVGAWAVGIKVEDPEILEMAEKGDIKGLSLWGVFPNQVNKNQKVQKNDESENLLQKIWKAVKGETKEDIMNEKEVKEIVQKNVGELQDELSTLKKQISTLSEKLESSDTDPKDDEDKKDEKVEQVQKAVKEIREDVNALTEIIKKTAVGTDDDKNEPIGLLS